MKKADPLPPLLRAFFYEWLVQQRNASGHTVRSYRDTWRLFLRFVARRYNRTVAQLRLEDLPALKSQLSSNTPSRSAATP
jgi:site-specific recombinase XerD